MLKYAKKVQRLIPDTRTNPKTVLRNVMLNNYTLQKEIVETFIKTLESINPKDPQIKFWYKELTAAQEKAIDCAHKLAPYEHPKLESMEIKQKIEHRMVIRAPQKMANVEQWMKITGASEAKLDELTPKEQKIREPEPSLHDFDEDLDEIETQKRLN